MSAGTKLYAIQGDITKIDTVEAVVNAANSTLLGGGGVDGAIHHAAGMGLFLECLKLCGCKVGEAKFTKAYKLPCQYIIHTVGPKWKKNNKNAEEQLALCYYNSLVVAVNNNIRSVAFPSIATGIYHFPLDRAAQIAVYTVCRFVNEYPGTLDEVMWVLFDDTTFVEYDKALKIYT